jgi:hypothetical protein
LLLIESDFVLALVLCPCHFLAGSLRENVFGLGHEFLMVSETENMMIRCMMNNLTPSSQSQSRNQEVGLVKLVWVGSEDAHAFPQ